MGDPAVNLLDNNKRTGILLTRIFTATFSMYRLFLFPTFMCVCLCACVRGCVCVCRGTTKGMRTDTMGKKVHPPFKVHKFCYNTADASLVPAGLDSNS